MRYAEFPMSLLCTIAPTDADKLTRCDFEHESELAGWISPQGRYYKVVCMFGHGALARRLTQDDLGCKRLEHAGWAHLGMHGTVNMVVPNQLTRSQIDTLMTIAMLCIDTGFSAKILAAIRRTQPE